MHDKNGTGSSEEAWLRLFELLVRRGDIAVIWHEGRGAHRKDFDTIIQCADASTIRSRTYQKGTPVAGSLLAGKIKPGPLCWEDEWSRDDARQRHLPCLENMVEVLDGHQLSSHRDNGSRFTFRLESIAEQNRT